MAEKAGYKHFMLKEIFEQPWAVRRRCSAACRRRAEGLPDEIEIRTQALREVERIVDPRLRHVVACGAGRQVPDRDSWRACRSRSTTARSTATAIRSSSTNTLAIVITQSGETADTLAALREAKKKGARSIAICNVVGSMATREADGTVYTHAGPEIGVASTKAFTTQLVALHLLAMYLGQIRGTLAPEAARPHIEALPQLPLLHRAHAASASRTEEIAKRFYQRSDFLYLGRGINYPIALEGALKLKEISYIHAEGYPAGEMKHGPIALIDEKMPVVDHRAARPRVREDDRQHPGGEGARRIGDRADDARGTTSIREPARSERRIS